MQVMTKTGKQIGAAGGGSSQKVVYSRPNQGDLLL